MQIIKLNYDRHDSPIVGAIALIPILVGVSIHSNLLLLIGLILFTLAGLEMMLRPSGSEPDYGFGCLVSAINTILWAIILIEYMYSIEVARQLSSFIIISTILLYIVLYVIIRNKVYGLQNEERPLWKYMHGEL